MARRRAVGRANASSNASSAATTSCSCRPTSSTPGRRRRRSRRAGDDLRAVVNLVGGFAQGGRVHETPVEDFEAMLRLNLRPAYLVCAAALPRLLAAGGGTIVCVSARAALRPFAGAAGYAVAKAGVLAFVDALDAEYRDDGVRANAILPSVIDTPANRAAMPGADPVRMGASPSRSRGRSAGCARMTHRRPPARTCRSTGGHDHGCDEHAARRHRPGRREGPGRGRRRVPRAARAGPQRDPARGRARGHRGRDGRHPARGDGGRRRRPVGAGGRRRVLARRRRRGDRHRDERRQPQRLGRQGLPAGRGARAPCRGARPRRQRREPGDAGGVPPRRGQGATTRCSACSGAPASAAA